MNTISYLGWVGHNNIGDEAIYRACERLFPNHVLIPSVYKNKQASLELFGGGTIWPPKKKDFTELPSAGIGVGVRQPKFYNRRYSTFDLGYYLGKSGLSKVTDKTINKKGHYLLPNDFRQINKIDDVGVRGPLSHEILAQHGVDSKITGDTALILEPSNYDSNGGNKIAVTLRDGVRKWNKSDGYVTAVEKFCKSMSDEFKFVFLPLKPSDIPLHTELAHNVPNSEFKNYCTVPDVDAVLDEYATCELVIAERLHGSVLASCSYTPFISLEYKPKVEDFVRSIDMSEYNIRIDQVTAAKLDICFNAALSDDLESHLEVEVNKKRRLIRDHSSEIIDRFLVNE